MMRNANASFLDLLKFLHTRSDNSSFSQQRRGRGVGGGDPGKVKGK